MKTEKNDENNPASEEFGDLSVTDGQTEQVKGGPTLNFEKITYRHIEYDREI